MLSWHLAFSPLCRFAASTIRPLARSPPGSFASWLVRPLADSPMHRGRFAPFVFLCINVIEIENLGKNEKKVVGIEFLSSYRNDTTYGGEQARGRIV